MDIWDEIKKLQGYQSGNGGVDSYGVDHSGFSLRDELEYQSARLARENQLAENFSKQGIAEENYPQFGTNFWGGSAENNYGFGSSNIKQNIENVTNRLNNGGFSNDFNGGLNEYQKAMLNVAQAQNQGNYMSGINGGNIGAVNHDYTVNTESLVGKPSSYFQNNNTGGWGNNSASGWNNNTSGFGGNTSNGFDTNTNFGANPSFATAPTQQIATPTPWSTPATQISPVPWRNNQTLTPWAGGYDLSAPAQSNGNYISDEDLYVKMWNNIKQHEDVIPHPYLDTKGFITIGGGANVNDWNVFKNLNVTVDGAPATEAQKWEAYQKLRQMSDVKDANGNYINRNLKAKVFKDKTNIRISDAEARGLAQNHMNNDLAHLRKEFSDFDSFPLPLKEVLLDIQYNVKGGVNPNDWPNLYNAIRNRDIGGIVENVNRKDVQQSRNDWAKRTARSIRF